MAFDSKKEYKEKMKNYPFPSVSYELAQQIREKGGYDVPVSYTHLTLPTT